MVASFELFIGIIHSKIKTNYGIPAGQKAVVADLLWRRFSEMAKTIYKEEAKVVNIRNGLKGKRKMTGFWLFANQFINEMRKPQMDAFYLYEIFDYLDDSFSSCFYALNRCIFAYRRTYFSNIFRNECYFLL